jgi:hypothetical protein
VSTTTYIGHQYGLKGLIEQVIWRDAKLENILMRSALLLPLIATTRALDVPEVDLHIMYILTTTYD